MACRLVFNLPKFSPITMYLDRLHWLKIEERIEYKVALIVFKCLHGLAPAYLVDLIQPCSSAGRRLRSSTTNTLQVVRMNLSLGLYSSFASVGPRVWNTLPPRS